MQNINNFSDKRPATALDEAYLDIAKFVKYLKGDIDQSHNSESITIPWSVSEYIRAKIKAVSPIKMLAKTTFTTSEKFDVVMDKADLDQSGWISDNQITDKQTNITKKSIELHELYARPKVTQRLIDDSSTDVEEFVKEKIISQMASAENKSFLFGDGKKQPRGMLTYKLVYENYESNNNTIEAVKTGKAGSIGNHKHLIMVMEKLPSEYLCNATWIMSRNAASAIRQIQDESNKNFLWQNSIAHGIPDTLLGYPVVICDDMERLSPDKATTPVLFGNFYEAYQIVEKPDISLLKDPYNSKPFVEFYATKRIGGDMINFDAVKALRSE